MERGKVMEASKEASKEAIVEILSKANSTNEARGILNDYLKEAVAESLNYPGMYTAYCPECNKLLSDKANSTDEARGILNDHFKAVHDPEPLKGLRTPTAIFVEQYDMVDRPEHYAKGSLECIDWIRIFLTEEEYHGYLKGNILKYLWRHEDKGKPVQDLEKLRKYAEFLIDQFEREETERDILEENERAGKWAVTKKTRRIMRGEAMSPAVKFIDEKLAELEDEEED